MDTSADTAPSDHTTPPSRWLRATRDDDREALRELAGSYWYGVYAWWRRAGLAADVAAKATVDSFTRWITEAPPRDRHTGGGRMREWLPARLAELLTADMVMPDTPAIVIDAAWAEELYAGEPEGDADAIFQRRWALTVLEFTMEALRAEYAARGQEALFAEVAPFVGFEGGDEEHYATAAQRAGLTVGAARKAVFEFRKRHRELLRAFVGDTIADPAELDSEITALLCACDLPGAQAALAPLPTAIRNFKPDELLARAMRTVQMSSGGAGVWTPPSDAEIARLFPQYEMHGMLGRGGMGAVYRARQVALDRHVAIKLLPLEVSVDQDFADRFVREARAMAKLNHPHIITVYDFGTTAEGHLYFVMEFVEGANLADMIHGVGLAPEQALNITGQVCTALAYAHGKGVVHRDIKPANVMVDTEGTAKVADFGLARLTDGSAEQLGHTMTGTVMGTPDYMAPEQKRGMNVDHRADIFSVGVMLYEMLCKETPQGIFEPPSQRVGCDARIDQIVIKAMNRTPEGRYQSTTEMKAALDAALVPAAAPKPRAVAAKAAAPAKPASPPAPRAAMKTIAAPSTPPPKSRLPLYGGIAAAVVAVIGGIVFFAGGKSKPRAGVPTPVPVFNPPRSEPWQTLVSDTEWQKEMPGHEFRNGLHRVVKGSVWGKQRMADGAIRTRIRVQGETLQPRLTMRYSSTEGEYKLELHKDLATVQLFFVPPIPNPPPSSFENLGKYVLPKPLQSGDTLELELRAEGDHLQGKVNGAVVIDVRDATLKGPGQYNISAADSWFESAEVLALGAPTPAASPSPSPAVSTSSTPTTATKEAPWVNTLGMKFVPVPITGGPTDGKRVLFSVWETRVQDYGAKMTEKGMKWEKPDFEQGPTHPAVNVSWDDAQAFCDWLTQKEQRAGRIGPTERYRLPTDHEWSCAAGIGTREEASKTPTEKDAGIPDLFPWGAAWPPPARAGNYWSEELRPLQATLKVLGEIRDVLAGRNDGYATTALVGSYPGDRFGLQDLGGNASEWCEDWMDASQKYRVLRGASWSNPAREQLLVSNRSRGLQTVRTSDVGFRVVLAPVPSPSPAAPSTVGGTPTSAPANSTDGWISLLPLIDPQRDNVDGQWKMVNGELQGGGSGFARLALSYTAPEEYDFRIRFTRQSGMNATTQHLTRAGKDVMWIMGGFGNSSWGLEQVGGAKGNANATTVKSALENGRRYESVVKVRRDRVQVEIDGKQLVDHKTDWSDFSMNEKWAFPDPKKLGVGCQEPTTFHSIEVLPVKASPPNVSPAAPGKTQALFDGSTLKGWVVGGDPSSFAVEDGAIKATGSKGNLIYTGTGAPVAWTDFDLSMKVKTDNGANSGVWVHCPPQASGESALALEVQIYNKPDNRPDIQMTGSIFKIATVNPSPVPEGQWFDLRVVVRGKTVTVYVNGAKVNEWTEPENWTPPPSVSRARLGRGTIGLQGYGGQTLFKDVRITLP